MAVEHCSSWPDFTEMQVHQTSPKTGRVVREGAFLEGTPERRSFRTCVPSRRHVYGLSEPTPNIVLKTSKKLTVKGDHKENQQGCCLSKTIIQLLKENYFYIVEVIYSSGLISLKTKAACSNNRRLFKREAIS